MPVTGAIEIERINPKTGQKESLKIGIRDVVVDSGLLHIYADEMPSDVLPLAEQRIANGQVPVIESTIARLLANTNYADYGIGDVNGTYHPDMNGRTETQFIAHAHAAAPALMRKH